MNPNCKWHFENHERSKAAKRAYYYRNKDKNKSAAAKYRMNNKAKRVLSSRNSKLKRAYGITSDQYDQMLKEQNGVCRLCFRPPKTHRLSVDHCHKTGRVRGLLCIACNKNIIGGLERYEGMFERVALYLGKTAL